jgi:hypothetical protein
MAQPTTAKFGKMRVLLGSYPEVAVNLTSVSNANPAVATVASADISKFHNGDTVEISGLTGAMAVANGRRMVSNVNTTNNTFTIGVDLSAAPSAQTTGVAGVTDPSGTITYSSPCGLTTKNLQISKNLQEIDIPDCDDPDAPSWIARDVQNLSITVSGDGVAAAESVPDWNDAAISTFSIPLKVEIEFTTGMKTFTGDFIVDQLTFGAEQGGRVTLGFNAQSDGQIADVWTPA